MNTESETANSELDLDLPAKPANGDDFLIVGIGASAGGVQALKTFFENVPADSGIAYVVILHLSPDYDSKLTEILQTVAKIPVEQVTEKVKVAPNRVYVVPPNESLSMRDGEIIVSPIRTVQERRAPVDIFFRTLAESHHARAVAVVLSGTGANGSMGIKRIKERGGAAFVQNPREAEFGEMARHSIATDLIDEILNVADIPAKIAAYKNNLGAVEIPVEAEKRADTQQQALREIFTQLRVRTGHDFSNYKRATVLRRIERRVSVRQLPDLAAYAAFLKESADEAKALLKDLLISVTNFFRDQEAFLALERDILPKLLKDKKAGDEVRVWVAGCATGEEAYSLAMLFAEKLNDRQDAPHVQIFATDIDEAAVAAGRDGFYTLNDAADVSPARLRRFFVEEPGGFRIRRELREKILFANHNLLKDAPFSRLDLVTCRNLLIYFNQQAQERVMETFHFALNRSSYLFLGSSESIDGANDLYAPVNKEHRIFVSRPNSPRISYPIPDLSPSLRYDQSFSSAAQTSAPQISAPASNAQVSYGDLHAQILEQYAPPSLIINEKYDIVHVSERAGQFLSVPGGEPSANLFKMIRPELRLELSTAVYQAVQQQANIEIKNLAVRFGSEQTQSLDISVRPVLSRVNETTRGFILIIFETTGDAPEPAKTLISSAEPVTRHLEEALLRSQREFRYTVEQSEVQAEELKASNEELQAINEELRSTTEELETGKEELQSVNEELVTVNQELKIKIEELSQSNSDFQNLINSTRIGTIFLDRSLRVKMFTPTAREIFNLIPSDTGRPLSDITHNLVEQSLAADIETVLGDLQPVEREVVTDGGRFYLMQVMPYRTSEDRISGTIITFVNITTRKQTELALYESAQNLERQSRIFDTTLSTIPDFAYMFDKNGRFVYSNQPLLDLLNVTADEITGKNFHDLNYPEELAARLQNQIQKVFDTQETVTDETPFVAPSGAQNYYEYIFNPLKTADGTVEMVVGSTRDVTERKRAENNLAFLADFNQSLITLPDEKRVVELFGKKMNDLTNAAVCAFFEISEPGDSAEIAAEWHQTDAFSLTGKFKISELVSPEFQTLMTAGQTIVVRDINHDSLISDKARLASFGIGSFVNVPVIQNGEWKFVLGVYHSAPYDWRADEIALLDETAVRICTKLEQIRAVKTLRESDERLRQLIKNLPGGAAFVLDREMRYLVADGEALAAVGFTPDHFIGKTIYEALSPELVPEYETVYRKAISGEPFACEHDAHGRTFLTRGTPLTAADGGIYGVLAVSYDLSERRQAEEKLRESEDRLSLIIKSIGDYAIITTDSDGIINSWNPGAEIIFGYTENEVLGKSLDIIFTEKQISEGVPERERLTAFEKGRAEDDRPHVRKDGSQFFASGGMQSLKGGKVEGFVKIVRDTTEKLVTEKALRDREMLQKLVGAQEDERRRIARDLHDHLGQQLTALRLKLNSVRQMCSEQPVCDLIDESQTIARSIDADVDFLARELRPAALDHLGLQTAMISHIREWMRHSNIKADYHIAGIEDERLPPEVETNFYRIMQEALNNILKHAAAENVGVLLEKRSAEIVLIVEDDGIGFDVENKDNRKYGIGLIGMRERVALVGGTLEIESAVGRGTTIFARVPLSSSSGEKNE